MRSRFAKGESIERYRAVSRVALTAALLLTVTSAARAQGLSALERQIVEHVTASEAAQIALLERVVNINSGTLNEAGVRAVGEVFARELESIGFETEWIALPDSLDRAGHLFARRSGDGNGKRILLIGHLDTVFEPHDPFQTFERAGDTATGPGVNDMKGGDVIILYALKALEAAGALDDVTITVALLGDEEKPGAPEVSRASLIAAARETDVALGFETSTGLGWATVARRGTAVWRLEVSAQQAHSSGVFTEEAGAGAIFEAARILDAFYSYLRGEAFLTFNPGVILGGTRVTLDSETSEGTAFGKSNVVANTVIAEGDLRFISQEQRDRVQDVMREIVAGPGLPQTSAQITFTDGYPAMPPTTGNEDVLAVLDAVSRDLGHGPVRAWDPGMRGAADISFVAHLVSGIDGLGAIGDRAHAPGESIDLATLPLLTQRAALLIYRLGRQPR